MLPRPASQRLKRVSHGANPACPRRAQHRAQYVGKHVRVLVAVNVGKRDAERLDLANLRFGFALDFFGGDLLAHRGQGKLFQAAAKA